MKPKERCSWQNGNYLPSHRTIRWQDFLLGFYKIVTKIMYEPKVVYESKKYTLLILNIINTHSIKLNMRAVEYCTMNVLKHKWHFWCIKLRVIVHNLLSSTIKLNGLWNQSEMWKETHLHTHILHNCTERSNEHAILKMYYLQMNKKSAGV